jgi:hypothetical protein
MDTSTGARQTILYHFTVFLVTHCYEQVVNLVALQPPFKGGISMTRKS